MDVCLLSLDPMVFLEANAMCTVYVLLEEKKPNLAAMCMVHAFLERKNQI